MSGEEPLETRNIIRGGMFSGPVLQGRDIQASFHLPAPAPVALAQLPVVTAGFSGREDELATLAGLLDPAGTSWPVVVSAVAGLAGVGKTTLAVQAGHAALEQGWFAGGVLFVDLHGYDQAAAEPGQALDALLRALGMPAEHIPPTAEERAGLYRSVLAQISEPVLLIADNASAEAQVRPLLPGAGPHKVLITSRHTLAGLDARLVDLTVLGEAAGIELLDGALRAARPDDDRISGDQQNAARLAGVCGGLPLALQIVGALLKADPTLSTTELAGQLSDEKDRLAALRYDDGSGIGAPSVAAAFKLSYDRLDETAARVFRLLPVGPGPDVSTEAAAVLVDLPVPNVRRVLADLAAAHLTEAAPGKAGWWQMHDLVHLYAQRLSEEHAEADGRDRVRDRLLSYYLDMADAAGEHLRALPGMDVPSVFADREGALAWLDAERVSLVAAVQMAADTGRERAALHLPFRLGEYLSWRRRFDDWITTTTTSLDTARRLGDRVNEGVALTLLGLALWEVRRFEEAITACQNAATIYRETGDRYSEATALGNLGLALADVRRFEEAMTAHQDAAAIFRETGDRQAEGMALNNLGSAKQAVRRFEEAITAHQDAAAIFRELGDRHGEAMALNNLGNAKQAVRRFEEAITAHQDAAAIFRETGDRQGEGMTLNNLGVALREVRRFEEAITTCQDAANIYRETGDRHGEGGALDNLGVALREVRRFEEAITACQDAANIYRDTGDRHAEGTALNNLGSAQQEARRFEEAISTHQDAAAIYGDTRDRHGQAMALTNLGNALQAVQRSEEAIATHQDAAGIYRDTGDRHGEGSALNNLGLALADVRRFEEAITAYQDAAAIFRDTGDRRGEALALTNLGSVLRAMRRSEEAITAHQDAAAIFRDTGDRHREAMALTNLGLALADVRRFEEAITTCQDAANIYRDTRDRHSEAMALTNLGIALHAVQRSEDAITAFQDAAAIFRESGDHQRERIALGTLEAARATQPT
jgi:tetratricopeptide (TPR) repeat protein